MCPSTSLAALLIGAGTPAAFAACTIAPTTNQVAVSNSASINCIDITGITVTNDVTNTSVGVITGTGNAAPTRTGITVNNSSIGGAIVNAGRITSATTGNGIFVTNNATVSGGVANSGTISTLLTGIMVRSVSTFAGGISNTGTISAAGDGVFVASVTSFAGGVGNAGMISAGIGLSVSNVGTVTDGISNASTIEAAVAGIFVDAVTTFAGGVSNSGTISAAQQSGIIVENITTFAGGIGNTGTITANQVGIVVTNVGALSGGIANIGTISAATRTGIAVATVATFAGGISNAGTIAAAQKHGINVDGVAAFAGGIGNAGTISAGLTGIMVRNVSTFAGGISNTGVVSAVGDGVFLTAVTNFAGGIGNAGTISAGIGLSVSNVGSVTDGISNSRVITASVAGIFVDQVTSFTGGVTNSGTISGALRSGIIIESVSTFTGGVGNSGTILAHGTGIFVNGVAATSSIFAGGISNAGTISAQKRGIFVDNVTTFAGGIGNSGTISSATTAGIHLLNVQTFLGGLGNSGVISSGQNGIDIVAFGVTFAGGVSNGGVISAGNVGIFVDAVTSFTGGISNSGRISAAAAGIFVDDITTLAGGISNSGTISAANLQGIAVSGVAVVAGGISNSGMISANQAGILVDIVNSFSGGVSNSGTISAAQTGIRVTPVATFTGGISNSGTISGGARGILVENSSAVSVFDSGVIVGAGGTAVDLHLNAAGNTFTLGSGYSITGNVLGQGNDTFQLGGTGSGAFDLSTVGAAAQYRGFTTFNVVSGVWTVSNVFGQAQAWNVNGGTLAGTGTLPAVIVNSGGTLSPGTIGVPGTAMTITGNVTFHPGASYQVALDGTTSTLANVGGAASLAGGVQGTLLGARGNVTYDILHAGAVSGTFDGFSAPNFAGTLSYTPTDVLLNLTAALGNGGGLNQNQQSVANGINTFFNNGGSLPAGFANLFGLTDGNLANALTQLSGENAAGAATSTFQLGNDFFNLLTGIALGTGGGGGGVNLGTPGFAAQPGDGLPPELALAYDQIFRKAPVAAPSFEPRWTAWGAGFGGSAKYDGDAVIGSNNLTAADFGFAAGMDYHAAPDAKFGFALAGAGTNWSLAQGLGGGRSDVFQAAAYGIEHFGPLYVTGMATFGNSWFTTTRTALGDQLRATFTGQSYGVRGESGYRLAVLPAAGITPYAAIQSQWFRAPGYSETDLSGGGFGLTFNSQSANDTRGELGARADDLTSLGSMPLLLRARLAWAHDWVGDASLGAVFQALPGSAFTVNGAAVPANSALVSASAQLFLGANWSFEGRFDGELASSAHTYAGTGTLRYSW
ncbi:MAG TPA: autotransporter domain-containing protein [Xanthobacteraceae bacterium]|jgi:uncharacterized protein with beta-barrel porin domain